MTKFAYNNAKNANISYMPFELNCGYHFYISFEKNPNSCFWSRTAVKLSTELQELMTVYREKPLACSKASKASLQ